MSNPRRTFLKQGVNLAALSAIGYNVGGCDSPGSRVATKQVVWPVGERPDTPKVCTGSSREADADAMRAIKQIGADHVLMGGPPIPWKVEEVRSIMDRFEAGGLKVINMMISGFPNTIYGREGRDQEIEQVQQSLRAAGAAGLPVVEYNFYAHRLMEGYHEVEGRGVPGIQGLIMIR